MKHQSQPQLSDAVSQVVAPSRLAATDDPWSSLVRSEGSGIGFVIKTLSPVDFNRRILSACAAMMNKED
ncbi:hypothetical protein KAR02_02340 [Candidatus Bipolaricaulota bacterium]|nr:hypothetical protein [Candidatus Bipolaricaulota bacterium]